MKNLKFIAFALLLCLTVSFTLIACNDGAGEQESESAESTEAVTDPTESESASETESEQTTETEEETESETKKTIINGGSLSDEDMPTVGWDETVAD